jgi:uncharacterized protein YqeY
MADSALKQELTNAMKDAMRAKDKFRLGTIRLALSEVKKIEVDERIELDDARITAIIDKMMKQRRESIKQYEAGDRSDLAEIESAEIVVLQDFMPQALTEAEVLSIVEKAIADTKAESIKDMGNVMSIVRPAVLGRADMAVVSQLIKSKFS